MWYPPLNSTFLELYEKAAMRISRHVREFFAGHFNSLIDILLSAGTILFGNTAHTEIE